MHVSQYFQQNHCDPLLWLLAYDEVHWSEELLSSTPNKRISRNLQSLTNIPRTTGDNTNLLHPPQCMMRDELPA